MELPFTIKKEEEIDYFLISHLESETTDGTICDKYTNNLSGRICDIKQEPNDYSMNSANEFQPYLGHDTVGVTEQVKENHKSNEAGHNAKRRVKTTVAQKRKLTVIESPTVYTQDMEGIGNRYRNQTITETTSYSELTRSFEVETERTAPLTSWRNINTSEDIILAANFDLDLKIILKKYEKYGQLNATDQITLSKAIIKCYLFEDNNRTLKKRDFERVTEAIVRTFPTEVAETYYIKSKMKRARGKLFDQYQHLRSILISVGCANKRRHHKGRNNSESESDGEIDSRRGVGTNNVKTELCVDVDPNKIHISA